MRRLLARLRWVVTPHRDVIEGLKTAGVIAMFLAWVIGTYLIVHWLFYPYPPFWGLALWLAAIPMPFVVTLLVDRWRASDRVVPR